MKDECRLVSVLIPARNEESNIEKCLRSVLSQSYNNLEIIVYDDSSSDNTNSIVTRISAEDQRVKLICGKALPDGWRGKNHACWILSKHAQGSFYLFIDSDVILEKEAVNSALSEIINENADMLSVFPKQDIVSFGEKAVVPFLNWVLLSFLPVNLVSASKHKSFAGANGQFMLWKKESYNKSGGHSAVKNEIVEDIETAKFLKRSGYKILLLMSNDLVSCRMYTGINDAVSGFSKNVFPASGMPALLFILIILYIAVSFLAPFILMFYSIYFTGIAFIIILQRIIVSYISSQNIILNILFHPVQMTMLMYISIISVYRTKSGNSVWKGRKL